MSRFSDGRHETLFTSPSGRLVLVRAKLQYAWQVPPTNARYGTIWDTVRYRFVANVTQHRKTVRSAWGAVEVRGELVLLGTTAEVQAVLAELSAMIDGLNLASFPYSNEVTP